MQLILHITDGPESGAHATVPFGETLMVGRAAECGLSLPNDEELSRVHFSIVSKDEGFALKDLNSANQTIVDDAPIELTTLNHGDEIQAGQSTFFVTLVESSGDLVDEIPLHETTRFKRPDKLGSDSVTSARPPARIRANAILLLIIDGPHKGEQHIIDQGHAAVLGRAGESTIMLANDEALSRVHFTIDFTSPDAIHIKDLGSANGTKLNRRDILTASLKNGDVISAGDSKFHIQLQINPQWSELDEGDGESANTGFRNLSETLMIKRSSLPDIDSDQA